jgi:hypothetical protein
MFVPPPAPPAKTKTETDVNGYFNPPPPNPNPLADDAPRVDNKGILFSLFNYLISMF